MCDVKKKEVYWYMYLTHVRWTFGLCSPSMALSPQHMKRVYACMPTSATDVYDAAMVVFFRPSCTYIFLLIISRHAYRNNNNNNIITYR